MTGVYETYPKGNLVSLYKESSAAEGGRKILAFWGKICKIQSPVLGFWPTGGWGVGGLSVRKVFFAFFMFSTAFYPYGPKCIDILN